MQSMCYFFQETFKERKERNNRLTTISGADSLLNQPLPIMQKFS